MNRNFHRSLPDVFTLLIMKYIKSGISKGDVYVMLMFLFMGLLTMSAKVFRTTVQDGLPCRRSFGSSRNPPQRAGDKALRMSAWKARLKRAL